jgi:hypothetical protein
LLACALILGVIGSIAIRREVVGDGRFRLNTWHLELGDLPAWVTPDIRREIEGVQALPPERDWSLFRPGVLAEVRDEILRSPWIASVGRIDARYPTFDAPGVLGIQLLLRKPVALVEHAGLFYLADADGRRLGAPYQEPPCDWFGVPAIVGLAAPGDLPEPGEAWAARDVHQGLEVARVLIDNGILADYPQRPIQAIDLSNLHGRLSPRESEIVLRCGGQRLTWGRSRLSAGARTATVPQLIANLRHVLSHPDAYRDWSVIHLHRSGDSLTGIRG